MASTDVVVVGSCMIDLISYAPRLPNSGETLHGHKFTQGFGGKGCNQCVAAKKLGADVSLIARLGSDTFGQEYKKRMTSIGIPTNYVTLTDGIASGMAQIIVSDDGENQIVIVAGANNRLSPEDVIAASESIVKSKVLITQMEVPVSATIQALKIMAEKGKGVSIFNAAPAQLSLEPELYSLPTIFCVNEPETELLTGEPLQTVADANKAVKILRKRGCQHIIITLGANGAVYAPLQGEPVHVPGIPAKVVDTTGAGDAFIGALAFFIAKKSDLSYLEAITRACAVASLSVEKPGTQTSFPSHNDLPMNLLQ